MKQGCKLIKVFIIYIYEGQSFLLPVVYFEAPSEGVSTLIRDFNLSSQTLR